MPFTSTLTIRDASPHSHPGDHLPERGAGGLMIILGMISAGEICLRCARQEIRPVFKNLAFITHRYLKEVTHSGQH
jgi:hypothetical protein